MCNTFFHSILRGYARFDNKSYSVFNLEIRHRGLYSPRQHLTEVQIWKLGINVKRQRTPSDVNTSCAITISC
jgi:hypothetical protein